jgi:hypothetical protein
VPLPAPTSVPTACDPWANITIAEGKKGGVYGPFTYTFTGKGKGKNAGLTVGPFYGEQEFLLNPTTAPVISDYDQDRDDHCPNDCAGCYIKEWDKNGDYPSYPEGACYTNIDRCTCLAHYGQWKLEGQPSGGKKGNEMYWCAGFKGGGVESAPCDVCCNAAAGQDCSAGPGSHVGDNNCYDPFADQCESDAPTAKKGGYDTRQLCYENGKGKYLWCSGDVDPACPTA